MIEYLTLDNAEALDAFVRAHPRGHIMQSSAWGRVKTDWIWHGILCRDSRGRTVGSLALLEHRCRLPGTCLLYGPRGPLFDEPRTFRVLIRAARELARERGAWLLRLDPEIDEADGDFRKLVRELGFTVDAAEDFSLFQPRLCYVKELSGLTPESLELSWHRTARTHLRQARSGPLSVRIGSAADLPSFHRMMEQTAARCGFEARPLPYFEALLRGLGDDGVLYLAECRGQTAAGAVAAFLPHTGWFLYGCSGAEGLACRANELLQWTMQREALVRGCTRWDLRGVEGQPLETNPHFGLHRYKRSLGAELRCWIGQLDLELRPGAALLYRGIEKLRRRGEIPRASFADESMDYDETAMRYGL